MNDFLDVILYCSNTDLNVKKLPKGIDGLYSRIDYNESNYINISDPIAKGILHNVGYSTGLDLPKTLLSFVTNFNTDPFSGEVGLLFLIKTNLPIPIIGTCNRDYALSGEFGYGIKIAASITLIILMPSWHFLQYLVHLWPYLH